MASSNVKLTEDEIQLVQKHFNELDVEGTGTIKIQDLDLILKKIGLPKLDEMLLYKLISELDENHSGFIKFADILQLYYNDKKAKANEDDMDTLDAFVAMGGNENKEGKLDAKKLINIIKNEFEMTIDIEKLIQELDSDGSGEIEYNEFKALFNASNFSSENAPKK